MQHRQYCPSPPISGLNTIRSVPGASPGSLISQDSSEFEFDFSEALNEPPVSPKLVNPNFPPQYWEISAPSSSGINLQATSITRPSSVEHHVETSIATMGGVRHELQIHRIVSTADDHIGDGVTSSLQFITPDVGLSSSSSSIHEKHDITNKESDIISFTEAASGSNIICGDATDKSASFNADHTRRVSLRSLMLEKCDLEQTLPPSQLANSSPPAHEDFPETLQRGLRSNSSTTSTYSYIVDNVSVSANSPSSSPPKKCTMKKWPFKMDFLKKASSVKGQRSLTLKLNQELSSGCFNDRVHRPANRGIKYTGDASSSDEGSSMIKGFQDGAGCSLHNPIMDELSDSIIINEPEYIAKAIEYDDNQSPARLSTCSSSSLRSISLIRSALLIRRDGEVIRGPNHRINKCASAPVSHAGSPSRAGTARILRTEDRPAAGAARAPATSYTSASVNRPMSPHAQHYQQQRARAEDLRRRTFLPYRQSLLSAFFFHSAPPQPQVMC